MMEHPTAADLEGLVCGTLSREQAKAVVRHLLRGCPTCVARVAPYAATLLDGPVLAPLASDLTLELDPGDDIAAFAALVAAASGRHDAPPAAGDAAGPPAGGPVARSARPVRAADATMSDGSSGDGSGDAAGAAATGAVPAGPAGETARRRRKRAARAPLHPGVTFSDSAYDQAIDRAFAAVVRHGENAARDIGKARSLLDQLIASGVEDLQEPPPELQSLAGFELLLEQSWALRRRNPRQMVKLAEIAAAVAASLGDQGFSAGQVRDFRARATIELANALRVVDRLKDAEACMDLVRGHFREAGHDRLLGARFLEVEANLCFDRHHTGAAFASLEIALRIYRRYGDPYLAGRCLIKKGLYTSFEGRHQEAAELLNEGLEMVGPDHDPELTIAAVHNTAWCLMAGGRHREARSLLWRHLGLYEQHGGRQDRLKLRWLQAQIYSGLADFARAERAFADVRQQLKEAGDRKCYARATMDLAQLELRRGQEDQARALALEVSQLFRALDVTAEALDAMEVLETTLQRSSLGTVQLVDAIQQLLTSAAPDEQLGRSARSA